MILDCYWVADFPFLGNVGSSIEPTKNEELLEGSTAKKVVNHPFSFACWFSARNVGMNPGFGPLGGNHQLDGLSWGHSISQSLHLSHRSHVSVLVSLFASFKWYHFHWTYFSPLSISLFLISSFSFSVSFPHSLPIVARVTEQLS